jgi:hypothetical protein
MTTTLSAVGAWCRWKRRTEANAGRPTPLSEGLFFSPRCNRTRQAGVIAGASSDHQARQIIPSQETARRPVGVQQRHEGGIVLRRLSSYDAGKCWRLFNDGRPDTQEMLVREFVQARLSVSIESLCGMNRRDPARQKGSNCAAPTVSTGVMGLLSNGACGAGHSITGGIAGLSTEDSITWPGSAASTGWTT